jgi:hypothetical protein
MWVTRTLGAATVPGSVQTEQSATRTRTASNHLVGKLVYSIIQNTLIESLTVKVLSFLTKVQIKKKWSIKTVDEAKIMYKNDICPWIIFQFSIYWFLLRYKVSAKWTNFIPWSGKNYYICKCKIGWSGDGKVCGPDRDLDGWPDFDLPCQVAAS